MVGRKQYWKDEEFVTAVANSFSVSEVLQIFGLSNTQPHYRKRFFEEVVRLDISIAHFNHVYTKEQIQRILGTVTKPNTSAKNRLLKTTEYKCSNPLCSITEWLGAKITLDLDHIDGDRGNNDISNLRFLCPNCHSQTDTHRNKNVKSKAKIKDECKTEYLACKQCGNPTTTPVVPCQDLRNGRYCFNCWVDSDFSYKEIINWPSVEEIIEKLKSLSFVALGRELGVSDNAIRKFLRRNNVSEHIIKKHNKK